MGLPNPAMPHTEVREGGGEVWENSRLGTRDLVGHALLGPL